MWVQRKLGSDHLQEALYGWKGQVEGAQGGRGFPWYTRSGQQFVS